MRRFQQGLRSRSQLQWRPGSSRRALDGTPAPYNPQPRLPPSPDLDPLRYPPPSATWEGRELFNCQAPRFIIRSRAPEPSPSPCGNVWIPGSPISVIGPRVPSPSEKTQKSKSWKVKGAWSMHGGSRAICVKLDKNNRNLHD
ncbi:unnamed protein product [Bemisia tabaci]|uniref:Uncharacterized protein n=1 Tax=Bemisia tabaci TaxID=7038 RepID=A0A9P0A722_BEMTA|nr:unnamed protein product [Bemisia tabaci]